MVQTKFKSTVKQFYKEKSVIVVSSVLIQFCCSKEANKMSSHRSLLCEYGDNCTKAHSQEELHEWQKRIKATRKKSRDAAELGLLSYQDILLEEYRHSDNKKIIVSGPYSNEQCVMSLVAQC